MHITIISVGKVKEKYIKQGVAEFEKRLQPYCKLRLMTVTDEQDPHQVGQKQRQFVQDKEGQRILQHIKPDQYVIALDMRGTSWSSEQFAREIEQLTIYGQSAITFVIGGSHGLSEGVLQRADQKLSFSKMTFPHQFMKLILLEQLYRAFKIQKNEPYHK